MLIIFFSLRNKTKAHRSLKDDVPHNIKLARLKQLASQFRSIAADINRNKVCSQFIYQCFIFKITYFTGWKRTIDFN